MKAVKEKKVESPPVDTEVIEPELIAVPPAITEAQPLPDDQKVAEPDTSVKAQIIKQKRELPEWLHFKRKPKLVTYPTYITRKPEYGGMEMVALDKAVGLPRECVWDHKIRYLAISCQPKGDCSDIKAFDASEYQIKGTIGSDKDIKERENDGFYPGELWEPIKGWKEGQVAFAPDKTWMEKFSPLLGIGALAIGIFFLIVLMDLIAKI